MLVTLDDLRTRYGFSFPESQNDAYSELLSTAEEACLSYSSIEQGAVEEYFNGGGHLNASGGEFYGSMSEAVDLFKRALVKYQDELIKK